MATLPRLPAGIQAVDAKPTRLVELQSLIDVALADLRRYVVDAGDLVNERPIGGPGFLTPDAREARNKAVKAERSARYATQIMGLKMPGETPAPLNVAAVSIGPEAAAYLAGVVAELNDELHRAGVCWIGEHWQTTDRGPRPRTFNALAADVSILVRFVRRPARLEPIHRGLEDLVTRARRVVVGEDRTSHPDLCPHCRRKSLVVYLNAGVIRCEHDPDTGRHEPCTCTDNYCPCRKPGGQGQRARRHEWHRAERAHKATSWQGLRRDQHDAQRREDDMTDAIAAVERIRALHAPREYYPYAEDCDTEGHRQFTTEDGDVLCTTCPPLEVVCSHCLVPGTALHDRYPCPTIRAIDEPDTSSETP